MDESQTLSTRVKALLADLSDQVSILDATEAGAKYCRDWADEVGEPAPVVRPRTPEALARSVARLADAGLPMVPQGGMSGLVGGGAPRAGEVVISTELLRQVEHVDVLGGTMRVQAGVTLQAVQEEAQRHGLFYPVDLGARGSCQIGGNIATNAGGNRVLQYGMTRASVLGLEVVLADGTVISRLGEVIKDNAGYDLKHLFIGSEGTLGIVSRATLRLQPLARERITALIGCTSLDQVLKLLVAARRVLGPGLTAFEVMWRDYFERVNGLLGIGRDPFAGAASHQVLLEVSSFDPNPERDRERIEESLARISEMAGTDKVAIAQSLKEAAEFWKVRDSSGEVARSLGEYLSFDISIPASRLAQVLSWLESGLEAIRPGLRKATYGHLGDGNLHLLVESPRALVDAIEGLVYGAVVRVSGSISAEHGIGTAKREALAAARPPVELALMRRIKSALDPKGLLSPGRVLAELAEWPSRPPSTPYRRISTKELQMPEILRTPFRGASAWTREDMERDRSWRYFLSAEEVQELREAVRAASATGLALVNIDKQHFPLRTLAGRIERLAEELESGRGFEMWSGLPIGEWTVEERGLAYWGIGRYLGSPVVQNARGELFGHVMDSTGEDPLTNVNARFYHTNRAAPFHVDGADIVGLMCVRTAKAGGASLLVSSTSIYNRLLIEHPDLIDSMYEPLWFDHRGERNAVTGKPYWETSIAGWVNGKLSIMYLRNFIESGQRYEGAPPLSEKHRRLLELIDDYAQSPELCLSMDFRPGDIQWLNNHVTLHSRTGFTDWDAPDQKRWLMRLWLNQNKRDRFTETYGFYGIAANPQLQAESAVAASV
jgi:FAD/FMN-containing dehydrogenase